MRRQTPIGHLLYNHLYPNPTPTDPGSFPVHVARNLVPEVRIEVATFYGDLNSAEARYPGLNYCYGPHRMRLGRFPHHKHLFAAFDSLGLTDSEIQDFCCWEGTKWARERYEKDECIKVLDTTGDEIKPFVDPRTAPNSEAYRRQSITRKTDISVIVEEAESASSTQAGQADQDMSNVYTGLEPTSPLEAEPPAETAARRQHISEVQQRRDASVTQRINRRIIAAWEQGQSLPPELEQYLKEQSERGNADLLRLLTTRRQSRRGVPPVFPSPASSSAAS